MFADAFHMRHEAWRDEDVELAASVCLIRQMRAGALYVECRRNGMDRRCRGAGHEGFGRGFGHDSKFVTQPLGQCRVVPFCRTSIAGKQEAADQMSAIHLTQRVELDKASRVSRSGKMFTAGILVLHEAFQPLDQPPPERLAAKERPIVELGTIGQREAREEVAPVA